MIDGDPQKELDMILNDLFKNINDLTLRSQEVEVELGGESQSDRTLKTGKRKATILVFYLTSVKNNFLGNNSV